MGITSVDDKYKEWIIGQGLDSPELSQGKCVDACKLMMEVFPELSMKTGIVYSFDNDDNYGEYQKEYPHAWLADKNGKIIDPTESQFFLILPIEYKELEPRNIRKCMGCGTYYNEGESNISGHCGECKWSKEW